MNYTIPSVDLPEMFRDGYYCSILVHGAEPTNQMLVETLIDLEVIGRNETYLSQEIMRDAIWAAWCRCGKFFLFQFQVARLKRITDLQAQFPEEQSQWVAWRKQVYSHLDKLVFQP